MADPTAELLNTDDHVITQDHQLQEPHELQEDLQQTSFELDDLPWYPSSNDTSLVSNDTNLVSNDTSMMSVPFTCRCTRLYGGRPCSALFTQEYYDSMRDSCAELNKGKLDNILLGQIMAFMYIY